MRQHFRLSSFVLAALIVRNNRVVAQSNGNTAADTPTLVRSQPAPDSIITKRAFFNFNAGLAIQIEQLRQIAPKEAETVRSKFSSLFGITVAEFDDLAATSARVITELAGVRASAQSYAKLRTEASSRSETFLSISRRKKIQKRTNRGMSSNIV